MDERWRVAGERGTVLLVDHGELGAPGVQHPIPPAAFCRWPAERSQSGIQGLKDRTRVTRAGEERADLGQQRGIGMQRIEVGERERWERRQLSGRAGADVIGVGDEARVGGGTGEDRDAQDRPGVAA